MFINDVVEEMETKETKKNHRLSLGCIWAKVWKEREGGREREEEKPLLLLILNKWNNN